MIRNIAIVSLSAGTIGEAFVSHEVKIGVKRLQDLGCNVKFMPNALKGIDYVKNHPADRARDLVAAFEDPEVDMILCAIGGDDTFRLLPYLFDHDELRKAVSNKVFLGFSDTTINHLMLHKVGLPTFYGQSFLADVCEIGPDMPPYTRRYLEELIQTGRIQSITPSAVWYEGRTDYGVDQVGTPLISHEDQGFVLLQGKGTFSGKILGGCIDSLYDLWDPERYEQMPALTQQYHLFPSQEDWAGRIMLLESSEEQMSPAKYRRALQLIRKAGAFDVISGLLIGKPMDRKYEAEYWEILQEELGDLDLPIVCNVNIGHAAPRCIMPFGVLATVDVAAQRIDFHYDA